MKTKSAFWDTSAIVPICCVQHKSFAARQQVRIHQPMIVWWATKLEALNSFTRLRREKNLTEKQFDQARNKLEILQRTWAEITPTETLRTLTESLLTQYPMSTADGLQLAAALIWCRELPRDRPFICADIQLANNATKVGFDVYFLK